MGMCQAMWWQLVGQLSSVDVDACCAVGADMNKPKEAASLGAAGATQHGDVPNNVVAAGGAAELGVGAACYAVEANRLNPE